MLDGELLAEADQDTTEAALGGAVVVGATLETTASVNCRSGGSTSFASLGVLARGTRVTAAAASPSSSGFYKVTSRLGTCWVSGSYLASVAAPIDGGAGGSGGGSGGACSTTDSVWTCSADGKQRQKCVGGQLSTSSCASGCLRNGSNTDAQCLGGSWALTCPGTYGTTKSTRGDYYLTAFGCWVDANGVKHGDSGDNCIPSCLAQARAQGLCLPGDTGKACEERVNWFTADGARFGCLARLRITNPANGKSVVAVALDYGPACWVEKNVNFPILDASGRVNRHLFGSDLGAVDRGLVHVVEVDKTTPLGPVP